MDTVQRNLVTNGDMSGAIVSEPVYLGGISMIAVHAKFDGSPSGDLSLEVSIGLEIGSDGKPTLWESFNTITLTGAAGTQMWLDSQTPYTWVRLTYSPTAGTGTLNAILAGKGEDL